MSWVLVTNEKACLCQTEQKFHLGILWAQGCKLLLLRQSPNDTEFCVETLVLEVVTRN